MSQQIFVDRNDELRFLLDRYHSQNPECIIIYGRRRVGKTTLLAQFLKKARGFYFLASEEGTALNISDFAHYAGEYLQDPDFERGSYPDWKAVFQALISHRRFAPSDGGKVVIVIDEFPYLIGRDKATPSIFQKIWDQILAHEPVMLIISGSSVSAMESEVLAYTSPLYGRRTGQWQVEPLPYPYLREILPYTEHDLILTWCILGGIPAYLRLFNPDLSFWENVEEQILTKGAYLYSEAELLMHYEFREAGNYISILRALVSGHTTLSAICQATGLDKGMVSKYLAILSRMKLILDEAPITAHAGFRRRHYRLRDPYLTFWFRFVYPRRAETETGKVEAVLHSIQDSIAPYCGEMFEILIEDLVRRGILFPDTPYSRLGRWWQNEIEIDIVGLDERTGSALFCECKWSEIGMRDARSIMAAQREKAEHVRWRNGERKERYALIAREIHGKEQLRNEGYHVIDLQDITLLSERFLADKGK
ncbi:MAG: ATP-binding protein [Methanocalculus sp. MSAO_Arc1]|uniref:ATP-binding protein n=1 Tax=Methanocalculus TaxID=71151 RepID=UPI000FF3B415|nr:MULTISPECIES: ATP-binding protein [unclassified Methanocalculus]MCP1662327.1 AAA+ ATPase superfamily predicted ATPase [Methanocalculus sp. AMF5]RQD81510.1 MAG: ATP-binding protein [Methanocalculus sp. MSAO_Arc1]